MVKKDKGGKAGTGKWKILMEYDADLRVRAMIGVRKRLKNKKTKLCQNFFLE